MGLFSKPEYKETKMPIRYVEDEQELKDGLISLESYSSVEGITKYFYCLYGVKIRVSMMMVFLMLWSRN